jgi:anaerobic magnesium-protoporphyrin IX monomethyl ester cyclase
LVYRQHGRIVSNAPRPLIQDLDSLPWIKRNPRPAIDHGIGIASMLASRGCLFNCSFCSIRQFYGSTTGPLRRVRSPENVVAEMRTLYQDNGVGFFIFQDDDFAARTPEQRRWMAEYLMALEEAGLVGKIGWKIACRVDDLEPGLLQDWIAHGLMCVYLGVEAGNPLSLITLNKHVSLEQNIAAIELLKQHQVLFSIGFMLFDPSSTVAAVQENIDFLRQIASDGAFPVSFCKMLPYAGTPVEAQLIREGRLKNNLIEPDYDFLDARLDWYAFLINRIFHKRNFEQLGLVSLLGAAQFDLMLVHKFSPALASPEYKAALKEIIRKNNVFVLDTLDALLDLVMKREIDDLLAEKTTLLQLAEGSWQEETAIQAELSDWLLEYNPELLRVFASQSIKQLEIL